VSAEPPDPLDPLDPDVTPDASSRIAIDPSVRPQRRSWSAMLRESWHVTAPDTLAAQVAPSGTPDAVDPALAPGSRDPAKPR
jgi:hypothetical protein